MGKRTKLLEFSTACLDTTAYLATRGIRLLEIRRGHNGRCEFVLDDSDRDCERLVREFADGAEACARDLLRELRSLKWQLHNRPFGA